MFPIYCTAGTIKYLWHQDHQQQHTVLYIMISSGLIVSGFLLIVDTNVNEI